MPYQHEVNDTVARIKILVAKHGGDSPKLKSVRDLYQMFSTRPSDTAAWGMLQEALKETEKAD